MNRRQTMRVAKAGVAVLLSVALLLPPAGCRPVPEEVIARATDAFKEVQTYRMDLTTISSEGDETNQSEGLVEFAFPDRLHMVSQSKDGDEVIIIGQEYYYRRLDGTEWRVRELPVTRHNLAAALVDELESLTDLVVLPGKEIDGVTCFHYRGSVDMDVLVDEQIAELDQSQPGYDTVKETIEYQRQWSMELEFWIAREDFRLLQVSHQQEVQDVSVNVTYRFYDFNAPIEIEAPPEEDILIETPETIDLVANSQSSIGGEDPAHQTISYQITISNRGAALAEDVRVFADTEATNQGRQTLEAEATGRPVDLASGEDVVFRLSWEYDMTETSKVELIKVLEDSVFWVEWTDGTTGLRNEKRILERGGSPE
jgi:hypothetical protein